MDRDYALRWLHLGFRDPRYRDVIEKQHRISREHVVGIWAEQEALDAAREWPQGPALLIAPRYEAGRPLLARHP